jgi:hypothetical protein
MNHTVSHDPRTQSYHRRPVSVARLTGSAASARKGQNPGSAGAATGKGSPTLSRFAGLRSMFELGQCWDIARRLS